MSSAMIIILLERFHLKEGKKCIQCTKEIIRRAPKTNHYLSVFKHAGFGVSVGVVLLGPVVNQISEDEGWENETNFTEESEKAKFMSK